jgi:hypothetical protein
LIIVVVTPATIPQPEPLNCNESGRFGALKSDTTIINGMVAGVTTTINNGMVAGVTTTIINGMVAGATTTIINGMIA